MAGAASGASAVSAVAGARAALGASAATLQHSTSKSHVPSAFMSRTARDSRILHTGFAEFACRHARDIATPPACRFRATSRSVEEVVFLGVSTAYDVGVRLCKSEHCEEQARDVASGRSRRTSGESELPAVPLATREQHLAAPFALNVTNCAHASCVRVNMSTSGVLAHATACTQTNEARHARRSWGFCGVCT